MVEEWGCVGTVRSISLTAFPGMTGESGIEDNDVLDQQLDVSLEAAALKK